ncbi:MAG: hypothetical protein WB624_15410 [Xanthobacteraceae bacterium]|jgi:hypothetical protein
MDRDTDIGEINRELARLRARYAGYAFATAIVSILASFVPVAALVLKVALFDMLYGAFFVLTLAIVLAALLGYALHLRWIDVVSQSPDYLYDRYFAPPGRAPHPHARSEAELIEWQIADRERRLEELGVSAD